MRIRNLLCLLTVFIVSAIGLTGCTIKRPISVNELHKGIVEHGFSVPAGPASGKIPVKVGIKFDESSFYKHLWAEGGVSVEFLLPAGQILKRASNTVLPLYFVEVEKVKEWLPDRYDIGLALSFKGFSYTTLPGFKIAGSVKVSVGYKLYDRRGLWILSEDVTSREIISKPSFSGTGNAELAQITLQATTLALKGVAIRISSILTNPGLAVTKAEKHVKSHPQDAGAFLRLANAHLFADMPDNAITAAKRGLEIQPGYTSLFRTLGHAYHQEGNDRQAMKYFKQAGDLSTFGLLSLEVGAYDAAIESFRKQVKGNPSYRNLFSLALAEYLSGKSDDALSNLEKALAPFKGGKRIGVAFFEDQVENVPVLSEIVDNSPARSAGLLEGDIVVELNGEPTKGMGVKTFTQKIASTKGAYAVLKVKRDGSEKPMEIKVVPGLFIEKRAAEGFGLQSLIHRFNGLPGEALKEAEYAYSLNSSDKLGATCPWCLLS